MTSFDDREKAFETKFAHDAEMQFKAEARRNKKLGLWAAGQMGLSQEDAANYANAVVVADLEEPGDEDVFRKVAGDFAAKSVSVSEADLRAKMNELLAEAKAEIFSETQ
ncbi:MAG: DUF1476 domain-containing protein [Pseudomonadota bacterium]